MTKTSGRARTPLETTFRCRAPEAKAVFLVGAFNNWSREATAMEREEDGGWVVSLRLPPGYYEYKFVVDGEWCCEPGHRDTETRPHCVPNPFGTMNCFVEVPGEAEKEK